jgi:hypothetical protein
MLHHLDTSLKQLFADPAAPEALRAAQVSFATPKEGGSLSKKTLSLFMHEVRENTALRDSEPVLRRVGDGYERSRAPLRADCAYLVTAWSTLEGDQAVAEEHELLGLALAWLARFPSIPAQHLPPELKGQPYPPPALVAQLEAGRQSNEFWSALGIPPRPSFSLVVTMALDLATPLEVGPPVIEVVNRYAINGVTVEVIHFGGRVLGAGGRPLAGATVALPGGATAHTEGGGRFLLPRPEGTSALLQISAPGYVPAEWSFDLTGPITEREFTLTPK